MNKEENERENSQIIQLLVRKKRNSEEWNYHVPGKDERESLKKESLSYY